MYNIEFKHCDYQEIYIKKEKKISWNIGFHVENISHIFTKRK